MKRIRLEGKKKKKRWIITQSFFYQHLKSPGGRKRGNNGICANSQRGSSHTHTHTPRCFWIHSVLFLLRHICMRSLWSKRLSHTLVNTRRMCTESWVCLGRRDTCRSVCKQEVKTISRTKWWKEENKTKSSLINRVSDTWVQTQSQFFFYPPSLVSVRPLPLRTQLRYEGSLSDETGQTFKTLQSLLILKGAHTTRHFKYGVFSCRENTLTRGSVQN